MDCADFNSCQEYKLQPAESFLSSGTHKTSSLLDYNVPLAFCQAGEKHVNIRLFVSPGQQLDVTGATQSDLSRLDKTVTVACLPCEPGWTRKETADGKLWTCNPCGKNLYIIDPNQHTCQQCPAGAKCEDEEGRSIFKPTNPAESVWENTSTGLFRITKCLAGYVLVRDEAKPVLDRCIPCPPYFYSVEESIFGGRMWALSGKDIATACNP